MHEALVAMLDAAVQLADYLQCSQQLMQCLAQQLWACPAASMDAVCGLVAGAPAPHRAALFAQHRTAQDSNLDLEAKLRQLPAIGHPGACKAALSADAALAVQPQNAWLAHALAAALPEVPDCRTLRVEYDGHSVSILQSLGALVASLQGVPTVQALALQLDPCRSDDARLRASVWSATSTLLQSLQCARHIRSLHLDVRVEGPSQIGTAAPAHSAACQS